MKSKKAAMEMSVGTVVTIVLLMVVLGLGIFLIQKIFGGATDSVDVINEKVMNELNDVLSKEGAKVVVKLGSNKMAKIKEGTVDFGIAIGSQTEDGTAASRERLEYQIQVSRESEDCVQILGALAVEDLVDQKVGDAWNKFDGYEGKSAFAIISFDIPEATARCSQKFTIDVRDTEVRVGNQEVTKTVGGTFFKIQIV